MKPYAVYLLERFKAGESPEELALSEGISVGRIRIRLAVAAKFERKRPANLQRPSDAKLAPTADEPGVEPVVSRTQLKVRSGGSVEHTTLPPIG